MIHFTSLLTPFKAILKTRMLTLTHMDKNKWLRRGHLESDQKHSDFATLRKFVGICLLNQVPASIHCIPYSRFLVKKKMWGKKLKDFSQSEEGRVTFNSRSFQNAFEGYP
jgi:hypothetical protein